MFTFSVFSYMFATFVCWLYSFKLYQNYRFKKTPTFIFSFLGEFLIGLGGFIFGVSSFSAPFNLSILKVGYIIGSATLFIAFVIIMKGLVFLFNENKLLKIAPVSILLFGIVSTLINIFYFPYANPHIDEYKLIHWGQHFVPRIIFLISMVIAAGIVGISFLIKKSEEKKQKLKSLFISLSFILAGLGGGLIIFLNDPLGLFIAYSMLIIGFLFGFLISFVKYLF